MSSLKTGHLPKLIKITINQFTILPAHILDFEMHYSIESVLPSGYIIITDAINMEQQLFQDGTAKLTLEITDVINQKFKGVFKIVGGHQVRDSGKTATLQLNLIEEESINLSNLFWGKGYTKTTIADLLTEFLSKIKNDKNLDIIAPVPLENFAVPVNKSFVQTIDYFRDKYNLYIYRSKKGYIVRDVNTLLASGIIDRSDVLKYYNRTTNVDYYNKIKDLKVIKTDRYKIISSLPDTRTFQSDMLNKEVKYFDYSFEKSINDINTVGGGLEQARSESSIFQKNLMRDENTESTIKGYYFRSTQNLKAIEIVVASNIDLEPGTKVKLDLLKQGSVYKNSSFEKPYTGFWIVHSITEKITKGHITQKLMLIKPKL